MVLAALTAVFTAGGDISSEPQTGASAYTLRLVSSGTIRFVDTHTPVPDTLLFELLDASGLRVRTFWWLWRSSATTGWLYAPEWERRALPVAADTATGLARVLWLPSDGSMYGVATPDATLPGTTSELRARVPSLDGESGVGGALRSVTAGGRLGRVHLDVIAVGHRVTCGARQIVDVISVDTVRLAP